MKNSILTTIVTLICVLILASCGTATDTSSNVTSANTTEPTTIVVITVPTTQPTTIATVPTTQPTTVATTVKQHTTVKKPASKTVAHTAKKTASKTTKKKTVTTAKRTESSYKQNAGLTDAEVLWAREKANEYIKTLKGVTLDPTASGYTLSSGIPSKCTTKEKLLAHLKEAIDCDYESSLDADWHSIGMYVKMDKDNNGVWAYTIMNECYG